MSRVAKAPVAVPPTVEVTITGTEITVKGPKGSLTKTFNRLVNVDFSADNKKELVFKPTSSNPDTWMHLGTARAILNNMVHGVKDGYVRTLELVGVGYRAQANGKVLSLSLGYSHSIDYALPDGVEAETPNVTTVILKGIDKQLVGQTAAEIRRFRKPEPYKGKGVRYAGERVIIKETKKK
jgi:large subunit ribosomal protein L6